MANVLPFSVESVIEDVLQQHGDVNGNVPSAVIDLESRKAREAALRRNEAAAWLRKMVKLDLPEEPSVEEFRLGLRSGHILCNVLNQIQPGLVPKVVETQQDPALMPDGAALSAYQYFENVRNYIVAMQQMGLPTFDTSDLEQGGTLTRVISSVLALKSYYEWKQSGGNGVWKFNGNIKTSFSNKPFVRKASEPFKNSVSWTNLSIENSANPDQTLNKMNNSSPFGILARAVLKDKAPEEVPMVVETLISKVMEEIQNRLNSQIQTQTSKACLQDPAPFETNKSISKALFTGSKSAGSMAENKELSSYNKRISEEESGAISLKHQHIVDKQQKHILDLKSTLQATKSGMQFLQMKYTEEFQNLGLHICNLSNAAAGYHKVLEENRKLYNQVQDLKGSIRVYCRIRPFLGDQTNTLSSVEHLDEGHITINTLAKNGKVRKSFHFNKVFGPTASQEDVFSDTKSLIRSALDGFNVCIFAYGQTGSGKTYTMTGPSVLTERNQGVNYRALHDLFLLAEQRKDMFLYNISVQMMEIYNEQVRDLLVMDGSNNNKKLDIRNSSLTGLNVPDANLVPVTSTSDVIHLMNLGHKNRAVGSTALNDRSSRSHSCLTVHVHGQELTTGTVLRGCMHLVDLAGSERVDKSEVTGDRLKEAQHINRSLSALGDVIASLAQKNPHVPYRNSKLTQLLQDSLGGQAKTLMFVHISPELDAVAETISTLKFAERVSSVDLGAAKINKENSEVKELKEQIASLKAELLKKRGDSEQTHSLPASSSSTGKIRTIATLAHCPKNSANDLQSYRQPMCELGNIEAWSTPSTVTSTPRPLENLPCEDRKNEAISDDGVWIDKVMVNKVDHKYLQDKSNMVGNKIVLDDDDTIGSSDHSSEKDFTMRHNGVTKSSKIPTTAATPVLSKTKVSKLRMPSGRKTQSPAEKLILSSAGQIRIRRQILSDGKSNVGNRK